MGYFKGLDILEKLEDIGLWVTLLIVGALFVGFGAFDLKAAAAGIEWPNRQSRVSPRHAKATTIATAIWQGTEAGCGADIQNGIRERPATHGAV